MTSVIQSSPSGMNFDEDCHPRDKIGFILLSMEQTVEDDVFTLTPEGIGEVLGYPDFDIRAKFYKHSTSLVDFEILCTQSRSNK